MKTLDIFRYFDIIKSMEITKAVTLMEALAQQTRLNIFRLLVQAGVGGLRAGAIGKALNIQPATLSFHLKELKARGLLSCERRGRSLIYSADFALMNELLGFLTQNCCRGSHSPKEEKHALSTCSECA